MADIAIVYYSGFGHTQVLAESILQGIRSYNGVEVGLYPVETLDKDIFTYLEEAKTIVFGAPTYMGAVPYQFKKFMDDSSPIWLKQQWKDKLAAGFTNSYALSGGKSGVLMQLFTFASQHSMLWMPLGIPPVSQCPYTGKAQCINRLGSFMGLMAQSDNHSSSITPPEGDRKTAELFGEKIADKTKNIFQIIDQQV